MDTAGSTIATVNIKNNDMYGNGNSNAYLQSGITATNVTTSGNITTDPEINTTTLIPADGSPIIGLGLTNTGVIRDYTNTLRGITNDAGAYQKVFGATKRILGGATLRGVTIN
jgi:hypothetical protein